MHSKILVEGTVISFPKQLSLLYLKNPSSSYKENGETHSFHQDKWSPQNNKYFRAKPPLHVKENTQEAHKSYSTANTLIDLP